MTSDEAPASRTGRSRIDPDALTVALVVAPDAFPRNRFFAFYKDPAVARSRSRARLLRSVLRDLVRAGDKETHITTEPHPDGTLLGYSIPHIKCVRRVTLAPLEMATLRHLLARFVPGLIPIEPADGPLVNETLLRLRDR